jgi:2-polyprenyl-3-methyl-5-hydroxy-6-metoxy-1,4-benzoquinol methylase
LANEDPANGLQADEFLQAVREIRERVRARYPEGSAGEFALPDLMPVLHARDVAEAKVAAIGTVNPRPPGALNSIAQAIKKFVARLLDWHVREQVEFNRATVSAIDALLEALSENNRALARWGAVEEREIAFLRGIAELEAGFQHRASLMETKFQNLTKSQHRDFTQALELAVIDIQKRLWDDLDKVRADYERLIHAELRLVRQRAALSQAQPAAAAEPVAPPAPFDAMWFAERFRGSQEYVRQRQNFYVPFFQGRRAVLDLGCGRGEFLELVRDAGVEARGVDLSEECIALCNSKGLRAERADLFTHLVGLADSALDAIFSAQVVEHMAPERIPELIRLAASKLSQGGLLAIETPNPECLAVFATHFYLDPTHGRPVPAALLRFYMEEFGFGAVEIHRLSPAVDSMPSLASLPEDFRQAFFGGLDYAILGRKL